jgi:hypothetical protein
MCEFIGYEIKDRLRMRKIIEEQEIEEAELDCQVSKVDRREFGIFLLV